MNSTKIHFHRFHMAINIDAYSPSATFITAGFTTAAAMRFPSERLGRKTRGALWQNQNFHEFALKADLHRLFMRSASYRSIHMVELAAIGLLPFPNFGGT
jgi:hypothetical protein